jgi:hypothetical protein
LTSPQTIPAEVPPEVAASQHVFQVATGYIASTALYVAVKLGIADRLGDGVKPIAKLAIETGANEDALYRVLRLLSSLGIFAETQPRIFGHTLASSVLRAGRPESIHHMALWMPDPLHLRIYADAMHSVTTGQPAIDKTEGKPAFEYLRDNREISEIFNNAMTAFSAFVGPAVLDAYDFSGIELLVDVAGGHGQVLTSILQRYPKMRGVLFDIDHVIAGAVHRIRAIGLEDRLATQSGNFFESVPEGGDAYIMKHIIHDWDDEHCLRLLRNCHQSMQGAGRLICVDSVLPPMGDPSGTSAKFLDLLMMAGIRGKERTLRQWEELYAETGFRVTGVIPLQDNFGTSIVEGAKG